MPAKNESNVNGHESPDLDVSIGSEVQFTQTPSHPAPLQPREVSPKSCNSQSETPRSSRKRTKPKDIRDEYLETERKKHNILEQKVARHNHVHQNTSDVEKTD